jgi:hypothetical protein
MPFQAAKIVKSYGLWLCLLTSAIPVYAGSTVVGHISFAKGSNAAQQPGAAPRILGKDTEIFQGDNIQTTESSFVIVEFTDGAKVTVRPNSNFSIDHYDSQSVGKTAQLVLHQGGVNTSTGNIAKSNPESFQIKTPTTTVKPKTEKAEFAVRICDKICEEEEKKAAANTLRTEQNAVARVVDIKGEVHAVNGIDQNAKERSLSLGKPLYNSDSLYSKKDSYALMVFPDGQKITLQADSKMDIKNYSYKINGKKDQILFRLAAGGMRALTGSIGKNDHGAYAVDTPVATIGIRGTGTDSSTNGTNLNHSTWQGTSFLHTGAGDFDVPEGSSSFTPGPNAIPQIFPTPPNAPQPSEPRPDKDKSDPNKLFKNKPPSNGDTLVYSKSGNATVESNDGTHMFTLDEGETSAIYLDGETTMLFDLSDDNTDITADNLIDDCACTM